jgi:hypothetical protein
MLFVVVHFKFEKYRQYGVYRRYRTLYKIRYLNVLRMQSLTPVYPLSRRPCLSSSPWFWTSSFTRSIGAAPVFDTAAAVPVTKTALNTLVKQGVYSK